MREVLLGIGLLASAAAVVTGVSMLSEPIAWIVAGALGAVLSVVVLAEAA